MNKKGRMKVKKKIVDVEGSKEEKKKIENKVLWIKSWQWWLHYLALITIHHLSLLGDGQSQPTSGVHVHCVEGVDADGCES